VSKKVSGLRKAILSQDIICVFRQD